jgi:hypothetical protein
MPVRVQQERAGTRGGVGLRTESWQGRDSAGSGEDTRPNLSRPLPRALLLPKSLALLPAHNARAGDEECSKRRAILPFVREGLRSWAAGRRRGVHALPLLQGHEAESE